MIFTKLETVASAKAKMLEAIKSKGLETECVSITEAFGRTLAEDVKSNENIPGFVRTAMDGYAVKCEDVRGATPENPVKLKFIGEVCMGHVPEFTIEHGTCAYVPTGGMVPEGADGTVIIEKTKTGGDIPSLPADPDAEPIYIELYEQPKPNGNFVPIDEDVKKGEIVLAKGRKLRPQEIGTLASLGRTEVKVYKPLKMAIISTGDELVAIDATLAPAKVRDINSYSLMGLAQKYGMEITQMSLLEDDEELLEKTVREAMKTADIIAASGGSSVGKKDATARIFDKVSNPGIFVHGISLKPGKPTILGFDDETKTLLVGVPGHPASAMMSFEMVVMEPINEYMTGKSAEESEFVVPAFLTSEAKAKASRDTCITVSLSAGDKPEATPINKKSSAITMLSQADGYIVISAGEVKNAGDMVKVHLF